jgi:hypothetical protein
MDYIQMIQTLLNPPEGYDCGAKLDGLAKFCPECGAKV